MEQDRHMFPGGNTTAGFFSYYQYILPQDRANHIFCIKGGPGVGKSTFMKGIGRAMAERGHVVEYMHCSSDPGSLDGLVIPSLRMAVIDGTAPHVVDPKNPGAVDEIVNLGECWDLPGIKAHRKDIMDANAGVGKLFARVYRFLGAAKQFHDDMAAIQAECSEENAAAEELEVYLPLLAGQAKGKRRGRERKLFASAITPSGLVNYLDSILSACEAIHPVKGPAHLTSAFLTALAGEAVQRGLDVEELYCPVEPASKLEHLLIPELSLAFTTANGYHAASVTNRPTVDLAKYVDSTALDKYGDTLLYDGEQYNSLLLKAVETLKQAKELHDYMETFYVPHMDFTAVASRRDGLIERIAAG